MKKMLVALVTFCLSSVCAYAETIRFNKDNSVTIDVPANWEAAPHRGTPLPEMGNTFDIKTTEKTSEVLRSELIEYLKTIQIIK